MADWLGAALAINRSRVRIPAAALLSATLDKFFHTCASVTKQYNLVLANGRWGSAAGEVTMAWWKVMAACCQVYGFGHLQPASWLPRTRISSETLCSFRVWDYLYTDTVGTAPGLVGSPAVIRRTALNIQDYHGKPGHNLTVLMKNWSQMWCGWVCVSVCVCLCVNVCACFCVSGCVCVCADNCTMNAPQYTPSLIITAIFQVDPS